jgi:predicted acetyltransferase
LITFKNGASAEYINGFCEIFGDSKEFVHKIISLSNEVFEIYEDGSFCGGLCAIDVSINIGNSIKSGAYIYGAFITEGARGRGLFRKLCEYVHSYYCDELYDFMMTVPADSSLFELYRGLGFEHSLNGVVSLCGDTTAVILPQGAEFSDFDGDYSSLYFMHIQNDSLIKTYDIFKQSVCDFDIKYITFEGKRGYALFDGDALIFASGDFVKYVSAKKGLLMKITDFTVPKGVLCDILFEI